MSTRSHSGSVSRSRSFHRTKSGRLRKRSSFVAAKRPSALAEACRPVFVLLDHDQDGHLEADQVPAAVAALGVPPTPEVCDSIMQAVAVGADDAAAERRVDFATFVKVMEKHLASHPIAVDDVRALFQIMDLDQAPGLHADALPLGVAQLKRVMCDVQAAGDTQLSAADTEELLQELGWEHTPPASLQDLLRGLSSGLMPLDSDAPRPRGGAAAASIRATSIAHN